MASHFQATTLSASSSYPNSIAWSKENLVAVASGHLIIILNPVLPVGSRGLITLSPSKPFSIGLVNREDLLTACLLPICLSRDVRVYARSISWSYPGFSPNSGCLLAVCTTDGRVKIYRSPFYELSAEWVEVVDISDMLYNYLKSVNFGELEVPSVMPCQEQANAGYTKESRSVNNLQDRVSSELPKRRKTSASSRKHEENDYIDSFSEELPHGADKCSYVENTLCDKYGGIVRRTKAVIKPCSTLRRGSLIKDLEVSSENCLMNDLYQNSSRRSVRKLPERKTENGVLPPITARQYASRSALLSSLIVAWSPALESSAIHPSCYSSKKLSILAVGGKSGHISFWRICEPECYTIEDGSIPVDPVLIGLLQAHNSWVTAISWGIYAPSLSETKLVLATGSSDGSVKIWLGNAKEFVKASEVYGALFSLLTEVTAVASSPISTISLAVPVISLDKVVLAIGKGSGSLEVWICHISSNKFESVGVSNAHDQVVTGLAWALDGCCLYSCSQDNSVRSWVLHGCSLCETPFSPGFPGLKTTANLSQVSDLCFGLALSPGELMVAVVRSIDSNLLNPMYEARSHKAAVEFFWTGGQPMELPLECPNIGTENFPSLTAGDYTSWESTILWSLRHHENVDKPLVLWDVLTALLAFKKSVPSIVETIFFKWMSSWFLGYQSCNSTEKILLFAQTELSNISTRRLHLINIICRRLMLTEIKDDIYSGEQDTGLKDAEEGNPDLWKKLLVTSERELRARFVAFTFKAVLSCASCSSAISAISTNWSPIGVAQMERWVAMNNGDVHDKLKLLGSKIGELQSRISSICEYETEESCSICSAAIPFESPDFAWCEGSEQASGSRESHKIPRCAVSMQLCSIFTPMWYCVCCGRMTAKLPPRSFFTMPKSPLDVNFESERFALQERSTPLCLFCGILLQSKMMPEFLLSPTPV